MSASSPSSAAAAPADETEDDPARGFGERRKEKRPLTRPGGEEGSQERRWCERWFDMGVVVDAVRWEASVREGDASCTRGAILREVGGERATAV